MRTYIFTERERSIIKALLEGQKLPSLTVARIKHRVKTFKELESDVQLYLKLHEKTMQPSSAR